MDGSDGGTAQQSTNAKKNYDVDELLQLLSYYEAELQAKDIALSVLKSERARKCSSDKARDAELALTRDGFLLNANVANEPAYYSCRLHVTELENMAKAKRIYTKKVKQTFNALEKQHSRTLDELSLEKDREQNNTLKSDEFFLLIENEKAKVQQQLDQKDKEISVLENELEKWDQYLTEEKERQKLIVLYLINERKQLLLRLNEMRLRLDSKNDPNDSPIISELKKQVIMLNSERESLRHMVHSLQSEKDGLQRTVNRLEEDLLLIQKNILHKTREHTDTLSRPNHVDGVVTTNRGSIPSTTTSMDYQRQHHHMQHPSYLSHNYHQQQQQPSTSFPSVNLTNSQSQQRSGQQKQKRNSISAGSGMSHNQNYNNNNNNGISNHSTILLQRPSSVRPPPLGIKASNLPMSHKNLPSATIQMGAGYRTSNSSMSGNNNGGSNVNKRPMFLPPTTQTNLQQSHLSMNSYPTADSQKVEYLSIGSLNNPKSVTKRSSSLPRNVIQSTQLNTRNV